MLKCLYPVTPSEISRPFTPKWLIQQKAGSNLVACFEGSVEDGNGNSLSRKTVNSQCPSTFSHSHFHLGDVSWEVLVCARSFPIQLYLCSSSYPDIEMLENTTEEPEVTAIFLSYFSVSYYHKSP